MWDIFTQNVVVVFEMLPFCLVYNNTETEKRSGQILNLRGLFPWFCNEILSGNLVTLQDSQDFVMVFSCF